MSAWNRGSLHHYRDDRQNYERGEGEPFDDGSLIHRGYVRTTFAYELADGTLLYQQNRYDKADEALQAGVDAPKKKFLPCRPVNVATFDRIHNIGDRIVGPGLRRVLFNWPAIVRAGPGSTVFVTEGEKNAATLIAAGLLATTVISHKWTDECVAALHRIRLHRPRRPRRRWPQTRLYRPGSTFTSGQKHPRGAMRSPMEAS